MAEASFQAGAPCWLDLMTSNTEGAKAFYGPLLRWDFQTGDEALYGGYVMALLNGQPVAGIMQKQPEQADFPDLWSTYLGTDDAEATMRAVTEAGGNVLFGPMEVPGQGHMGMVQDPTGAAVGTWQPAGMRGYGLVYEPGAPYWHELFTRDFGASLDFYSAAFGWDVSVVSDSDEFRYATLGADAAARAGVMDASSFLPEGVPAHWRVYFGVEDARAAAEVVAQLGGTVLSGPEDTPYGTIVTIQDPFGAQLLLASGYPAGR